MKSRRIYLAEHPRLLDQHLDAHADKKRLENLLAVARSTSGLGMRGRLNASQPSGLDRLRAFNAANGRPQ